MSYVVRIDMLDRPLVKAMDELKAELKTIDELLSPLPLAVDMPLLGTCPLETYRGINIRVVEGLNGVYLKTTEPDIYKIKGER